MLKKIITVALCLVLLFGIASIVSAKNEKDAGDSGTVTAVEKLTAPKGSLKEKIGLAFTTGGDGSARMWITNSLGLDLSASIGMGGLLSDFGMRLGANIVFPMLEEGPTALYLKPGMLISFNTFNNISDICFNFDVGLEAEAFIVENLISVGGTIGLDIGIKVHSPTPPGASPTSFILNIGTSPAALFVRVYM